MSRTQAWRTLELAARVAQDDENAAVVLIGAAAQLMPDEDHETGFVTANLARALNDLRNHLNITLACELRTK